MILDIIVFSAFALDMILTGSYLKLYKERFPKNDWTLAESNPLIRFLVRRFGLNEGLFISTLIISGILIALLLFIPEGSKWFFLGIYYMANVHHFVNNRAMKKLNNQKPVKKIVKKKMKGGKVK